MNSLRKKKAMHDRATHEQLEIYIAFCQANPGFELGRHISKSSEQVQKLWKQLADELNAARGPSRTSAKWKATFGVWKSQLRKRARRQKMGQSDPNCRPLNNFEQNAITILGLETDNVVESIVSLGIKQEHDEFIAVENAASPSSLDSERSIKIELSLPEIRSFSPENQYDANLNDGSFGLQRGDRKKLINTLIANITKRNAAEEQRQRWEDEQRQQHREVMEAIKGLTNNMTDLINILKQQHCKKES